MSIAPSCNLFSNSALLILSCFFAGYILLSIYNYNHSATTATTNVSNNLRRLLQQSSLTQREIDARLKIYDEVFWENPENLENVQREVRLRQNCAEDPGIIENKSTHPDSGYMVANCINLHYRVKTSSISNLQDNLVVGVLSAAPNAAERDAVRNTWANGRKNVFFVVAGPWENIEQEYNHYNDIIWVDTEETYMSERGGLTVKTFAFLGIAHDKIRPLNPHMTHFFKTDVDVYVNLAALEHALPTETNDDSNTQVDFWGNCVEHSEPRRWSTSKWFVNYDSYPFAYFPPYCNGPGYAVSAKFLDCAVGQGHMSTIRFSPNEDVQVGMLAERCNIMFPKKNIADPRCSLFWDRNVEPTMKNKIYQHDIKTPQEMWDHHKSAKKINHDLYHGH